MSKSMSPEDKRKLEIIHTRGIPKSIWKRDNMTTRFNIKYKYYEEGPNIGDLWKIMEVDLEIHKTKITTFNYVDGNIVEQIEEFFEEELENFP